MKTKLYNYQEETANDIFRRMCENEIRGAYLGFDTGCVHGKNLVTVKNDKNNSIVMTVENLYKRAQSGEKFKIKSLVNGRFQFMPVAKVTYSGEKECIEISTDGDRIQHGVLSKLICTLDHPIFTEKGFVEAGKLQVNDTISANGKPRCVRCGSEIWYGAKQCRACYHESRRIQKGEYVNEDGYLQYYGEYYKNHPEYNHESNWRRGILAHRYIMEQHIGRFLTKDEVVHHLDGDKLNNDISNLKIMSQSEHTKLHSHVNTKNLIQNKADIVTMTNKRGSTYYFAPHLVKITNIQTVGVHKVYDVAIDDDDIHNFVCSDKVVHNTGKTVTSLSVAEQLYKNHMIKGLVVICPVSKVDDWNRDIKDEVPDIEMTFVSSFQSAWREKNKAKIELINKMVDTLVIIDEGHKMKTYDSKQSKFIQALSKTYTPYMLILSATSQNKKYIDLYPQYKALGSRVFDRPAKDFKKEYCIEAQNWNLVYAGKSRFPFNEIVGYKQTDVMDAEVLNYTYYKKYESEYDKPIEIRQTFKMTPEMKYFKEKKVWPKMDEDALLAALESGDIEDVDTDFIIANRPALHHIYMRESCSGFIKDMFLDKNPKAQWLEDFLEGNEGRLVVFTNFINETKVVSEVCDKKKRHWCIYDGTTKDLTNWEKYDDCIAIVNIQAGSAGLNDFIKTNIGIWFSYPENYIDFIQSKGRLDRIGQTKQPVFYFLEIAGSVEQAVYRTLLSGQDFDLRLFEKWLEEEGGK
jgi:hypothetical protein